MHTAHGQPPSHELAHVVAGWAVESAARGRFVGEVLAVAFDDTGRDRLAQALLAAHWSRTGKRASAERLAEEIARKHPTR